MLCVVKWCCIDFEKGLSLSLDGIFKLGAVLAAKVGHDAPSCMGEWTIDTLDIVIL